ncbi:MAG: hypothetical protein JO125_03385 [Chloroflexi bacterium]|nr:hypothetical protein [Ktedonobacteraceae bacterium]MBV9020965.1 hypothetical protein [Ktedonobacteraceae bacterium]MBV9706433.1 hypothetical protein [Chloroflexota bacterium]
MNTNQDTNQSPHYGGYTGSTPSSHQTSASEHQHSGSQGYQGYYQQQQQRTTDSQPSQTYSQAGQQQYSFYQPRSAQTPTDASAPTSTGMPARKAALFSYALGPISGLVFFLLERKNRFVRFSAAQSFILFGSVTIVYVLLRLVSFIPIVGALLSPLLTFALTVVVALAFLLWLLLLFCSYRGIRVKLPVISDYAERLVTRFSSKQGTV